MINGPFTRARVIFAGLLTIGLLVAAPSAVFAHSELVSSTPESGSTLDEAPDQVVLEFNEGVQQQGGTIAVTVGDQAVSQSSSFAVDGTNASVQLDATDVAGTFTVAYRIVSEDGHVVRDTYTFEVAGSGDAEPSASAAQTPSGTPMAADASDDSDGSASVVWILGLGAIGLVLVAALIAVAVRGRRGRSS